MRLSGTYHPIQYLLHSIPDTFPSIEQSSGIWKGSDHELYYMLNGEFQPLTTYHKTKVQEWRSKASSPLWLESDCIFGKVETTHQTNLYGEGRLNTLVVFIASPLDQCNDLLFFTFSKQLNLKQTDLEFNTISTTEKHLLSSFISQLCYKESKRVIEEHQLLKHMELSVDQLRSETKRLSSELKQTEELYTKTIHAVVHEICADISVFYSIDIELMDDVILRIARESLSYEEIKATLKNAAAVALNLNVSKQSIQITPDLLVFDQKKKRDIKTTYESDKIFHLLERYEESARLLSQQNLIVNGKNVAQYLSPPVSPPAITDALNKNQKRISFLLERYPERWELIRAGLKPLVAMDQLIRQRLAG